MRHFQSKIFPVVVLLIMASFSSRASKDTLRVMGYNVLYYGNGCQGPTWKFHNYLKTIIGYANPDLISLEKMASAPVTPGDKYAAAPQGFIDSVTTYALNAAYPGRYAYCPFTNAARSNNAAVLFYDQNKLGFVAIVSSYCNITDFNTYKLYYKDPDLALTHDTTFIYLTLNHDKSGDENMEVRGRQIGQEMALIKKHFTHLPNMINIGDFNLRSSDEPVYQELTNPNDTGFRFSDPPFFPDHRLSYPANWDHNPSFSQYLTTATRESATVPNSCGSGGGAKNWYDHIFISQWIANNTNHIRYIPNSYHTIGNDGKRLSISINNENMAKNTSAPPEVIDAIFHFSNKYPVMLSLEVSPNSDGKRPANPEIPGIPVFYREVIKMDNPVGDDMVIHFPEAMKGEEMTLACFDNEGNQKMKKALTVKNTETRVHCKLAAGNYVLRISTEHNLAEEINFSKN